ncbi:MAG: hypothetical protein R2710_09000 [Acidimicrobiales bacterium]
MVDQMVEMADLVPTVHELAGIEADYTHWSQPSSLCSTGCDAAREFALTEGGFPVAEEPSSSGLRTRTTSRVGQHDWPDAAGKAVAGPPGRTGPAARRLHEPPGVAMTDTPIPKSCTIWPGWPITP